MDKLVRAHDDAREGLPESNPEEQNNTTGTVNRSNSRLRDIVNRVPSLALAAAVFFATEIPLDPEGLGGVGHKN